MGRFHLCFKGKVLNVHAFKVTPGDNSAPLENVLQQISDTNIEDRIRETDPRNEVRVEASENRNGLWYLDFVKIRRSQGPGHVAPDKRIVGFGLKENEGFGEETAALYDPLSSYILIQYNHYGVRQGAIAGYFRAFDDSAQNSYSLRPKYDHNVERQLINKGTVKKILYNIDISKINSEDRDQGESLEKAIEFGEMAQGAEGVEIQISAGRGKRKGLAQQKSKEIIDQLRNLFKTNHDAVKKLQVAGKEDEDSKTEILDLIAQRLYMKFDIEPGADRRFPREKRWNCLLDCFNEWRETLK